MIRYVVTSVMTMLLFFIAAFGLAKDIHGPKDQFGNTFNLSSWGEDRLVVVAFLGIECPLGPLYVNRLNELRDKYANQGVCFIAVNSNEHDTYEGMVEFAQALNFPMLKDVGNVVADEFGATRSPEVFLLNAGRDVIYQGRIDDQYAPGNHTKNAPTRSDLEEAIKEALRGEAVTTPFAAAVGCHIDRVKSAPVSEKTTYSKHVAPIFDAKCVECHRPGQSAPFSLLSFADASGWTGTIRDVLVSKRMPPWSAAPSAEGIHFANDRSLSDKERATIFAWLDNGAPEGDPSDRPALPKFREGWTIRADKVVAMPVSFTVPKEGVLEYQEFTIDPGFSENTWINAIQIQPGNTAVVHHATIYLKPKDAIPGQFYFNKHDNNYLAMYVPGNTTTLMPVGTAKMIPAGWNLVLSVHYVPVGTEQIDQTSIALSVCDEPAVEIATRIAFDNDLMLQPGEIKTVKAELTLKEEALLTALYPHMHLRGKSMLFQAFYPNGSVRTLLDVPAYDFEWQHRYELAQPMILPAGTTLRCTGVFDNSAANPRNPDPNAVVKSGEFTTDEMMFGFFDLGYLTTEPQAPSLTMPTIAVLLVGMLVVSRRQRASGQSA